MKNPNGTPLLVCNVSEVYAKALATRLVEEEVRKAKHGAVDDDTPIYQKEKNKTLVEAWNEWRQYIQLNRPHESSKTAKAYHVTRRYLEIYHPQLRELRDIKNNFWEEFRKQANQAKKSNGHPHELSTVSKHEGRVKAFIKYLQSKQFLNPNLALGTCVTRKKDPRAIEQGHKPFTGVDELNAFLSHVETTPHPFAKTDHTRKLWAARFHFLAYTGLRSGEFRGLKYEDINLEKRMIKVSSQIAKGGRSRTIGLLPEAKEAFITLRALENGSTIPKKDALIVSSNGKTLWRVFNQWQLGFFESEPNRKTKPHALRGYYINYLIKALGIPYERVAAWSGATHQVLTHYYEERDEELFNNQWLDDIQSSRKTSFVKGSSSSSVPSKTAEAN